MNFKIGDKVICIVPNYVGWSDDDGNKVHAPRYDEILKIDFIKTEPNGIYLGFNKYNIIEGYNSKGFKKIDYDFVDEIIALTREEPVLI